ncbi:MAG TPA: hypothetical protein VF855_04305, partial [Acidimicrobiales bacterium]
MADHVSELTIDRAARTRRISLGDASWVHLTEGFVRDAGAWFSEIHQGTSWQQAEVLRYDRYVPERRLGCGLRPEAFAVLRQTDMHLRAAHK